MSLFNKFIQFAIGNGIVLVLGLISSPLITRIINPTEMGKYSMFNTITNLILLIVLMGIDQSYVRYYYEENETERGKLLLKCIKVPIVINLVLGVILCLFYKDISLYVIEEKSIVIVVFMIIHITGGIFSRFALLQVRMKQKAKLYSFLNVLLKVVYLFLVCILFFIYENTYITLVLATIFSNIVMTFIAMILERKEWFSRNTNKKLNTTTRELIKYGIPFVFSMAITWIFQSIDRIAIKEFCGYAEVGLYSGAMNIIALLNTCQTAFTTFWVPVAYEKYSINPDNKIFFSKINKIVSLIMLLVVIALISTKDIIVLFLGKEYRQAMYIFPYLVFMPVMYTISETTVVGINFKKKTQCHIYIAIVSAVFNIIGNIALVPRFGARGAAISTGISYIIFFIARTYMSNKYYKVNYNLGKFGVSAGVVYILATYSSFHKFNSIVIVLIILSVVTILILYKEVLKDGIDFIRRCKEHISNL